MKGLVRFSLLAVLLGLLLGLAGGPALAQGPVVRAVLFFSPTCPHCHQVINEDLPVIFRRFGGAPRVSFDTAMARGQVAFYGVSNGRVELLLIDASKPGGFELFRQSTERFKIRSTGVPRMIVGDSVLIGSVDIPTEFPRLIEKGLATSGIDWPDIAGMQMALAAVPGPLFAAAESEAAGAGEAGVEESPEAGVETSPDQDEAEAGQAAEAAEAGPPEDEPAQAPVEAEPGAAREGAPQDTAAAAEGAAPEGGTEVDSTPQPQPPVTPAVEAEGPESEAEPEPEAASVTDTLIAPGSESEAVDTIPVEGEAAPGAEADSALGMIPVHRPTMMELYRQDPVGNSVSVLVLIGMVLSLMVVGLALRQPSSETQLGIAVPLIAVIGIGVASYLTYIESSGATAVCGPVGDCNTVNQSEYAMLFGAIPVAALGLASYIAIIAAWVVSRLDLGRASDWAKLALLALCVVGTLFSVYLTFLEPFVIGATCAWCLTSAVAITVLMLLSMRPGREAWARIRAR